MQKIKGGSQWLKYGKTHYERNRKKYKEMTKVRQRRNIDHLTSVKRTRGCIDCGIKDPRVLDFDHVAGRKEKGLAQAAYNGWSIERLNREVEKCEVRCSNCHRIKTSERRSGAVI